MLNAMQFVLCDTYNMIVARRAAVEPVIILTNFARLPASKWYRSTRIVIFLKFV
jgi:hypothetical protein